MGIAHSGDSVIKLAMTNFGVCGGPILGLYTVAFFSKHRTVSAQIGTIFSLLLTATLGYLPVFGVKTGIPFLFLSFVGFISVLLISVTVDSLFFHALKNEELDESKALRIEEKDF